MKDLSKEKPKDLELGRLIMTAGTCKYCGQLVTIRAAAESSESERDRIATSECACEDAKEAFKVETSVRVLTDKINERYAGMPDKARTALISCLSPVAYGMLDKVTVKVDESATIKIYRSTQGLNIKRTTKEDDIMDEWSRD